jgi:hypothetical protein
MTSEDRLLLGWLVTAHADSALVWLYAMYLVAHGHSAWWFALALLLSYTNLYKILYKRFGVQP